MAEETPGITEISVAGFKSIEKGSIEIRPLTILAGANSSGKSSIMQPMLLMKQTLDASYDPGPLRLDGPHVQFTEYEQLLSKISVGSENQNILRAGYQYGNDMDLCCEFRFPEKKARVHRQVELTRMVAGFSGENHEITMGMSEDEIVKLIPVAFRGITERANQDHDQDENTEIDLTWKIRSSRCFFHAVLFDEEIGLDFPFMDFPLRPVPMIQKSIEELIHVPGLRGNPERTYRIASAQAPNFPGKFESYIAGLILRWREEKDKRLDQVGLNLQSLGLTKWIRAEPLDDVDVELRVGRLPVANKSDSEEDTVSIADVGFGVSQVLPVLVALAVAEPGQMVYIEQPELHLHPNAQVALAEVLADAAMRGVRVVIETHSAMLLQGIMTLIAGGDLGPENVKLHWFTRDETGKTVIDSKEPDSNGAYGDWPVDFANVAIDIHGRYLRALAAKKSD